MSLYVRLERTCFIAVLPLAMLTYSVNAFHYGGSTEEYALPFLLLGLYIGLKTIREDRLPKLSEAFIKPVVAKMAETFKEGREEGEKSILDTVKQYIVGASNASDDASFGVMYFEGTKAPVPDTLETSAAKFASSAETFKDLSLAIKPELINAHEIIVKCAGGELPDTEQAPAESVKAEEQKTAEVEIEKTAKEPSRLSKLSIIVLAIGIILCIIGAIGLVLSLKG